MKGFILLFLVDAHVVIGMYLLPFFRYLFIDTWFAA